MNFLASNGWVIAGAVTLVLLVISAAVFFVSRYRRCPANKILVISGSTGKDTDGKQVAKCISGGGAFVWPVIQEYDYLDLNPIQLPIKLMDALSFENIRIATPATMTVAIGTDDEHQHNAATRLLGLDQNEIQKIASDIIIGQMRQVIASMKIEEINKDREVFLKNIEKSLEPELKKIGLWLINVNIVDLKDESGYIEATGRKGAAEAVQKANANVAEQERDGTTKVADAKQKQFVAVAQAERTKEIGIATAAQEKEVAIALADRTKQIGIAQAQQEREVAVADANKTKEVGIATAIQEKSIRVAALDKEQRIQVAAADADASEGEAKSLVRKAEAFRLSESARRGRR
jgi:flotillin